MPQRKIIHIDMDCFYAAIEIRDNPKLRGRPVAVGGQPNTRGVLCTANYEARQFGVRSAMPSSQAVRACPDLIILPVNFDKYRRVSRAIREIFQRYTDLIEPLSLDEAYLDVTGSPLCSGSATLIAQQIRNEIFDAQELTASAGVAPNKLLAKIASDWNKPNGQFVITPDRVTAFMRDLPVKKLFGVGKVTEQKLQSLGLHTCGDIQRFRRQDFIAQFGHWGEHLYDMAHGIDEREVVTEWHRKSLSVEHTFSQDFQGDQLPESYLQALFEELVSRLKKSGKSLEEVKSLFVKVKYADFTSTTAQSPLNHFSLEAYRLLLAKRLQDESRSIRLLGFGVQFYAQEPSSMTQQLQFDF